MPEPKLHEIETVEIIHADGTKGIAKLRVIGIVKQTTAPEVVPDKPADQQEG